MYRKFSDIEYTQNFRQCPIYVKIKKFLQINPVTRDLNRSWKLLSPKFIVSSCTHSENSKFLTRNKVRDESRSFFIFYNSSSSKCHKFLYSSKEDIRQIFPSFYARIYKKIWLYENFVSILSSTQLNTTSKVFSYL